jgi:rRNA processing protein Krr1/Pno1
MTTRQEDKEIEELDPLKRCDYFQAIDLGVSHRQAMSLVADPKLLESFLIASHQ